MEGIISCVCCGLVFSELCFYTLTMSSKASLKKIPSPNTYLNKGLVQVFMPFNMLYLKLFFFSLLLFLFSFFCFNTIASFWNVLSYFKYPALLCCLAMLTSFFAMFLKAFWQMVHICFEFLMCYLPTFCSFGFLFLFLTRSSSHF